MISRRRFLTIGAAALASPAMASAPVKWQGVAMGAEVALTLDAPPEIAKPAIAKVRQMLAECESLFSLYDPFSALSQLNKDGVLQRPDPRFHQLITRCDRMYRATNGRFDPTVQPLWSALAQGHDPYPVQHLIGWEQVTFTPDRITLGAGQALTLNGIAQGFVTDLATQVLIDAGLTDVLVNIGEFRGNGRNWTLGVSDPEYGLVQTRVLRNRAIATSSPTAMTLADGQPHIVNLQGAGQPLWSTVSVEADEAVTADALSTAFCYADAYEIAATLRAIDGAPTAICVGHNGSITEL